MQLDRVRRISEDAVLLADAYNRHVKLLAQYWVLAATINIFTLAGSTNAASEFNISGIELPSEVSWQTLVVVGGVLNFAYCISHLQTYQTANTFRAYLNEYCGAEDRTSHLSSWNMSYQLLESALNRVYPIANVWAGERRVLVRRWMRLFIKPPIDLAVIVAPIFGPVWAFILHMPKDWLSLVIVGPILFVSAFATLSLLKAALFDDFKINPWEQAKEPQP